MGQTSKMYSFMHPSIKSKISIHYDNITEKELIQYLRIFTIFRNLCAHNERLFSFQTRFEIPDKKRGFYQIQEAELVSYDLFCRRSSYSNGTA